MTKSLQSFQRSLLGDLRKEPSMVMRLLSTPQGKSQRELDNSAQELRSIELDGMIKSKRQELDNLDKQLVASLSTLGLKNYEEEEMWKSRIKALTEDVQNLETRKRIALEPLIERQKEIDKKDKEISQRETVCSSEESRLLEEKESITTREKTLVTRETHLLERSSSIKLREEQAKAWEEEQTARIVAKEQEYKQLVSYEMVLREQLNSLEKETILLREEKKELLTPIKTLERAIAKREESLRQRENALVKREESIRKGEEEIATFTQELQTRENLIMGRERELQDSLNELAYEKDKQDKEYKKIQDKLLKEKAVLNADRIAYFDASDILSEKLKEQEIFVKTVVVPLENREKELDTKTEALSKREESISIKETDLTQTQEILIERLDEVSEREQNALSYSADLEARASNLSILEEQQKKKEEAVLAVMKETAKKRIEDEKNIAKQKAVLKGRDTVLNERERVVSKKEAGFANREKAIVDRYKTLERAIAEMKLTHGDKLKI